MNELTKKGRIRSYLKIVQKNIVFMVKLNIEHLYIGNLIAKGEILLKGMITVEFENY